MTDEARTFVCPFCHEPAKSDPHGKVICHSEDEPPAEYVFLQCSSCAMALVQCREDYGFGFDSDKPAFVYPAPKRLSLEIPRGLRESFDEAKSCFDVKAYTATLVMSRRILEGACKDQGATKRTLVESLRELQTQGMIDGMLAEWADLLRVVGNEGAHYTDTKTSREDAQDALDFTEALLDHLYVLRKRFIEFKARRPRK